MNAAAAVSNSGAHPARAAHRAHLSFAVTALGCVALFAWMVTFGTFRIFADDTFGNFYDHQAAAWLQGRWNVPEPALGGEAFIVDGKVYGYFGPTPALLRLPLAVAGLGFGKLTRAFLLLNYAGCLAAAYGLLWLATRWREAAAVPAASSTVLFTATVGLGSTLFFLGSRAYVYHEAILCGAAFALWSVFCALRYLQAPGSRWWIGALACGVLAIQSRAPLGLFALCVLGCVAQANAAAARGFLVGSPAFRRNRAVIPPGGGTTNQGILRPLAIGILCLAGVASFNLVSYVKFGTIEGCPLRYNIQYTPEKLAVLEHRNFHLSNLRFNSDAYLLRPIFSLRAEFPYLYREYIDRQQYPESRTAYRDQTLALPWSMPGLFALAVAGSALALATQPAFRFPLALLWLAAIPAAVAMLTAVAVTQRYTADFCPALIATAAFGVAAIETLPRRSRVMTGGAAAALTTLGILVTLALTLHHQREIVWGVPDDVRRDYQRFRARADALFDVPDAK